MYKKKKEKKKRKILTERKVANNAGGQIAPSTMETVYFVSIETACQMILRNAPC